jgi:FdhE protein
MLSDLNDVVAQAMQLYTELQEIKKAYVPQVKQAQPSFSKDEWKEHREKGILLFKYQKPVLDEVLCLRLADEICDCIKRNRPELKDLLESIGQIMDRVADGFFSGFMQNNNRVSATDFSSSQEEKLLNFVVGQALHPSLETYVSLLPQEVGDDQWQHGHCPVCGVMPNFSYLRQEDGKRYLICPFCGQEWYYRNLVCPWCGNDDHKSISYLEVVEMPGYEVYVCDNCHSYLKTYNAKKAASHDDWVLEDVKTLALDLIAQKRGYACPGKQMM